MATVEDVLAAMERVVAGVPGGRWQAAQRLTNKRTVEVELMCINGVAAWFTVAEVAEPDEAEIGYSDGAIGDAQSRAAYIAHFDPPTLTALLAVVKAARAMEKRGHSRECDARRVLGDPTVGVSVGPGGIEYLGGRRPAPWRCFCGHDRLRDALDALTRPPQGAGGE